MPKNSNSCNANARHQKFKSELRAYHDKINSKNRYNLSKIAGKMNVFEGTDSDKTEITVDRRIPNTALTVLERGEFQAIGDIDGKPLTDFKYTFIEGSLGDEKKIISCITDDGKIEYFDVDSEIILECSGACGGIGTGALASAGTGGESSNGEEHEIEYEKVKDALTIPYLSGYRIKDMRSGKLLSKGIKSKRKSKRRKRHAR